MTNAPILDIAPKYRPDFACAENLIAAAANHRGIDITPAFRHGWNFGYLPVSMRPDAMGFGRSIFTSRDGQPFNGEFLKGLKDECGIDIQLHANCLGDRFRDIVATEIKAGRPVIVGMDSFNCPWHKCFEKYHNIHYVLVVGTRSDDELLVVDDSLASDDGTYVLDERPPYLTLDIARVFPEDFGFATFSFGIPTKSVGVDRVLYDAALKTLVGSIGSSDFSRMRQLAEDLRTALDIESEVCMAPDPWGVDLARVFFGLAFAREHLCEYIDTLDASDVPEAELATARLRKAADIWRSLGLFVMKNWDTADDEAPQALGGSVHRAAELEEKLALKLVDGLCLRVR